MGIGLRLTAHQADYCTTGIYIALPAVSRKSKALSGRERSIFLIILYNSCILKESLVSKYFLNDCRNLELSKGLKNRQ